METTPIVLLVCGDSCTRDEYRQALATAGYRVEEATNVSEAVQKAPAVNPDVVVTELGLPAPSGFNKCRALKASYVNRTVPVIGLSGDASAVGGKDGEQSALAALLRKPVEPHVLVAQIRQTLDTLGRLRALVSAQHNRAATLRASAEVTVAKSRSLLEASRRERSDHD